MKKLIALAAVFGVLIAVGVFCGYEYYKTVYIPKTVIDNAEKARKELFKKIRPPIENAIASLDTPGIDSIESSSDLLSNCKSVNSDTVAWITISGTNIDYPIMQCDDNEFYLHNGADRKDNGGLGCPFLDFRCESDFSGVNSIIYGHHIEGGRMFSDIVLYEDERYFDDHRIGYLVTSYEVKKIDFFSYMCVSSNSPIYSTAFLSTNEKGNYIDLIFRLSKYSKDITKDYLKDNTDKHILLISTCTYGEGEQRSILVGVF